MDQAYFSQIRGKIIPYLEEAVSSVQVAMAWFTSRELFNALIECLKRNVKVDLVLLDDAINYMDYAPDFNLFINAGGNLYIADASVGFMHHKFCIIDSCIVITGSYNWTYYAETRNVENIIVTDNHKIIKDFESEFLRLERILSLCSDYKRMSWDEIESREGVNYNEINYEIESICEAHQIPVRRIFETRTEVIRTEIKRTPYSRYSIGIEALDKHDNVVLETLVDAEQKLPFRSEEKVFYIDSKHLEEMPCCFKCGTSDNVSECLVIKEVDLLKIATGTYNESLPVKFSMHLDDNGSLRIDVSCEESGERMTISVLKSDLVKYE